MYDSSAAEIAFENIKTGAWHLKIDAKSATGTLLYTGQTDLMVEDSKTTDVYMTLNPVSTGVGSVYISVKWASTSSWTDYINNAILKGSEAFGNPIGGVSAAKVLFENGKYRMWYNNTYTSGRGDIQYAESIDGIHWHNVLQRPVLSPGTPGSWDGYMVGISSIIKDEQEYKMYYAAFSAYGTKNFVGLAVSKDGLTWEKYPDPILTVPDNETGLCASGVVKKDTTYYMFYHTEPTLKINMAESKDGIHWTQYKGNPVLAPVAPWEMSGVVYASVVYDGKQFIMVYGNWIRQALGIATSPDGINWQRDKANPVFQVNFTSHQWTNYINYPFFFKNGDQERIYYTGPANGMNNVAVIFKQ